MTGSLQIQKGKYYAVLNIYDENDKRKQKWINTGLPEKGNKRAAQQRLKAIIAEYEEAEQIQKITPKKKTCDLTFLAYMSQWLKSIRGSIEDTTWTSYDVSVRSRLTEYFQEENPLLTDFSPQHLQDFYAWMRSRNLTGNTLVHYHACIRKALNQAFKNGLVYENVADKVDRPKKDKFVASYYDKDELNALFETSKGDPLELIIYITAFYGLRRSEVVGLKWDAVDFRNKTVTIRHKVTESTVDKKLVLIAKDKLKTKSSHRTMPLFAEVERRLLAEKERQNRNRKLCKTAYTDSGYIFVNDLGELIRPNFITQHFAILLENKGLRKIRFHDLRHPYVKHATKNMGRRFVRIFCPYF